MKIQDALEIASKTDAGLVRSHNEDSIAEEPACGLLVLADGMGGYNAGEVASGIAVSVIVNDVSSKLRKFRPSLCDAQTGQELGPLLLTRNIRKANLSIFRAAQSQPQYAGMGTTVVTALFYDNRVAIGHVGDSRAYRLRGEVFEPITRDHSLLQEQLDSGMITPEEARVSRNRNLVTRALGIDAEVEPEVHVHDVLPGDIYLLCSDGLNDMVDDADMQDVLLAMQSNLPLAVEHLIQMANDNGGRDNVSVMLVKVKASFPAADSWWRCLWDSLQQWVKRWFTKVRVGQRAE